MAGMGLMFGMAQKMVSGVAKVLTFGVKEGTRAMPHYNPRMTPEKMQNKLELMREYTKSLPDEQGLSRVWIQNLIKAGKTPELKTIIQYLKSNKADNLSLYDRAQLIHECLQKIDLFKTMSDLLH